MGFREVISASTNLSNAGDQPSFPASTLICPDGLSWGSQSGNDCGKNQHPSGSDQTPFGSSSTLGKIQRFEPEASSVCLAAGVSWGSKRRRTTISDPVQRVCFDDKEIGAACALLTLANQDTWKIKKKLTPSDIAGQSRLLIAKKLVRDHVIGHLDLDSRMILHSEDGLSVGVRDCDTGHLIHLKLKWWKTSKSYALVDGWRKGFVMRRNLNKGDEIGLYWSLAQHLFVFTVLQRAAVA